MLQILQDTQKHDDDEFNRLVESIVASYNTAKKRVWAIETLEDAQKKPNLVGQRVLEKLRETEAADRAALKQEVEQKQEQQITVQIQAANEKVAFYQKQVNDLSAQAAAAQTRVSELQKELDQKRATMSQNRKHIEQLENSLKGYAKRGQKNQWIAAKSKTEEENKQLLEETTTLEAKLQEATSASEKVQQAYGNASTQLAVAQKELASL